MGSAVKLAALTVALLCVLTPGAGATPVPYDFDSRGDVPDAVRGWAQGPAAPLAPAATGGKGPAFQPAFFGPGLDGNVFATVVWDDGSGPALYAAGDFLTAGGRRVNGIARWDGGRWSPLTGPGGTGLRGWTGGGPTRVLALTVHDDTLVAGGSFTEAGGVTAFNIARWDGERWSAFEGQAGPGLNDHVQALAVHDGDLVAGGLFVAAGGDPRASWVARWDGEGWVPVLGTTSTGLPAHVSGTVRALAVHDGELVVAGGFLAVAHWDGRTWVDLEFAGGIARWDGEDWSTLTGASGTGTDSFVNALAVLGGDLYVGGSFTAAGGLSAGRIARWDGRDWSTLGAGVDGDLGSPAEVHALAAAGGSLVVGGRFAAAGGVPARHVARWDGRRWSALAEGPGDAEAAVYALAAFDGAVVAGGSFTVAGGTVVDHLARWDGRRWEPVGSAAGGILGGSVQAAVMYRGDLVVAGNFDRAGTARAARIARWDGRAWRPLGSGIDGQVAALAVYDGELIAGGSFTSAGGVEAADVARWNGTRWAPLGSGMAGEPFASVSALAVYGGELIAGGSFDAAGGVSAANVARWDGRRWAPLGAGTGGEVLALTGYDGALVAGGRFFDAGGAPAGRVARWDGAGWSPLADAGGNGVNLLVNDLAVYAGDLIVAGNFSRAGGVATRNIAGWDGAGWFALGPGIAGFAVSALGVFDGGLIAGGAFTQIGGEPFNRVARWDGGAWSHLTGPAGEGVEGTEVGSSVAELGVFDLDGGGPAPERLLLGGSFLVAGGASAWNLGLYGPPPRIGLAARARKERGRWHAELRWSGETRGRLDVLRDGRLIATADGDGFADPLGKPKKGTIVRYRICWAGTELCSPESAVEIDPRHGGSR